MNLIRNLIGLVICVCMLPICLLSYKYVSNISFAYDTLNDEIGLCQLRQILLISYDIKNENDSLHFLYKNKKFELSIINNKLILKPGTQIFLSNIDGAYFKYKEGCLYIVYEKENKTYERVISSEKGIYLDDFSYCDVLDFDVDHSQE